MSHRHRKWPGVVDGWLDARGWPELKIDWSYENGIPNLGWQRSWISEGQQEVGCGERSPCLVSTFVLLNGAYKPANSVSRTTETAARCTHPIHRGQLR